MVAPICRRRYSRSNPSGGSELPKVVHNPERLNNIRKVPIRDVPDGMVCWYDGFWGVAVRLAPNSFGVDRWDAAPAVLDGNEFVLVPYSSRWKKRLSEAESQRRSRRPMNGSRLDS